MFHRKTFDRKALVVTGIFCLLVILWVAGYRADLPYADVRASYETPASAYVQIAGAKLHYVDRGDGEVLLLVHGSGAELGAYTALGESLIKEGFRVVALDLPGSGLSLAGSETGFHNDDNVALLSAFINALELSPKAIIGHSSGGQIAWSLGLDAPEVTERLVLLAPTGLPTPSPLTWEIARLPVIGAMLKNITPEFLVRQNLLDAVFDDAQVTDSKVHRYHDMLLRDGARDALFARMNAITFDRAGELPCLAFPTLLVWGEEDVWLPVSLADDFTKAIPNATLVTLSATGHNLPEEVDPEALSRQIVEWLRSPQPPQQSPASSDDTECSRNSVSR